jgi:hypothetical protein
MSEVDKLREALAEIAEVAREASGGARPRNRRSRDHDDDANDANVDVDVPGCTVKALPRRLLLKAAHTAMRINPVNAPLAAPAGVGSDLGVTDPMQIAVLTAKYWGPTPRRLTVSFMETTPANLRARILSHMNAWTKTGCVSFAETRGTGDVRITFAQAGYWSYLGTDILHIPKNRPTMCLQQFSMSTPESEYHRVVRHETGHTLGFPHEHMRKALIARIDPEKAYQYFLTTQGWDRPMVDAQVLTPLDERSIMGTTPDQTSIMCYQLPASITRDGRPIIGGTDINNTDYAFAGRIYPKRGAAAAGDLGESGAGDEEEDWSDAEDVEVRVGE